MLRRITACLNAIALMMVTLIPLTATSAKVRAATTETVRASKIAPELQQSVGGGTGTSAPGTSSSGAAQNNVETGG